MISCILSDFSSQGAVYKSCIGAGFHTGLPATSSCPPVSASNMETLRKMNFSGLSPSASSGMAETDSVMASDEKLKNLKKKMDRLYKVLRQYTESYRTFITSQQKFFSELDSLYEDNWVEKSEFRRSFEILTNIGQNGAKSLETIPIEETIVFKDQFGPYEKEIKDYIEKTKQCKSADRKVQSYQRRKNADADELRRLQNVAYEKATSVRIVQRKLQDELPKFYNSRMEFYSKLWRSVFQIQGDIAKAESETLSHMLSIVRDFDRQRGEGAYDCSTFIVSEAENFDDDDYSIEADPMEPAQAAGGSGSRAGGSLPSRRSSNNSFGGDEYAAVTPRPQKPPPMKLPKPTGQPSENVGDGDAHEDGDADGDSGSR
ncbi:hypothetical protein BOX15_Mlig019268g1 [Macrostomum lignano]|uniref:BAR domain-containing protein n=2 Tax=Macrostomum lignano TaxID=282301 RepID=A0A267ESR3_9PLAT|nr:hypothetical protein BOX15_Mlig019268g1 [Macrostomum lignano]